jgi:hypothetical protein
MSLTTYLQSYLGDLSNSFTLETDFYTFIVADTLEMLGISTEDEVTDTKKLHLVGILCLWKKLLVKSSTSFDFSANGNSFKTSQLYDFCSKNYANAYTDAYPYLDEGSITLVSTPISYEFDTDTTSSEF